MPESVNLTFRPTIKVSSALLNELPPSKLSATINDANPAFQADIRAYYVDDSHALPTEPGIHHYKLVEPVIRGKRYAFVLISLLRKIERDGDKVTLHFTNDAASVAEYGAYVLDVSALVDLIEGRKPKKRGKR